MSITADQLTRHLQQALEPLDPVDAMWLGGSKAFGRDDDLSDIDVALQVDDDHIESTFDIVRQALSQLSPISAEYRMAEPTWHRMSQCFYQLRDAPEHRMIDLCIRGRTPTGGPMFDEIEIHGTPVVVFDKCGAVKPVHLDPAQNARDVQTRLESVRRHYQLFRHLPSKELARGQLVDALHFYQQMVLATLMRLLRMRHDPVRYDWGSRYLAHHLPPAVLAELEPLYFISGRDDLERKIALTREWIERELEWWSEG